jgi:hypothetical protein
MSDELIRMDKEYVTRDGRAVRVLCVDAKRTVYPVAALCQDAGGEALLSYTATGAYYPKEESALDLIPKPVKHTRTVWVNVYDKDDAYCHKTKQEADYQGRFSGRIACKEITFEFEEGEGL